MNMNQTPSGERIHIGLFGKRNAGKSSLMNAITHQNLAVVSEISGTTTDPVNKAMELLPLGPVVFTDTPGLDDVGELGALRIRKAYQALNRTDIALLVLDGKAGLSAEDQAILERIKAKAIPYLIVYNKADTVADRSDLPADSIWVSAKTGEHIEELKERIAAMDRPPETERHIIGDLLHPGDTAVLVVPIDSAAPKGRLILPQQQTIRDILDANATAVICKETELKKTLANLNQPPRVVITDSQAFAHVAADTPDDVPLTSFSILMARYKGDLETLVEGAAALETVQENDTILISEGCTHHRQCEDIGTVKLPHWIEQHIGFKPHIETTSGTEFPDDLSPYKMIIHCGGCTLPKREMSYRIACARDAGVPITNYGVVIAYMQGILDRCMRAFAALSA